MICINSRNLENFHVMRTEQSVDTNLKCELGSKLLETSK